MCSLCVFPHHTSAPQIHIGKFCRTQAQNFWFQCLAHSHKRPYVCASLTHSQVPLSFFVLRSFFRRHVTDVSGGELKPRAGMLRNGTAKIMQFRSVIKIHSSRKEATASRAICLMVFFRHQIIHGTSIFETRTFRYNQNSPSSFISLLFLRFV